MPARDDRGLFVVRVEAIGAPYMVTGATAAILYGQPRATNDLDVVLSLNDATRAALFRAFPDRGNRKGKTKEAGLTLAVPRGRFRGSRKHSP